MASRSYDRPVVGLPDRNTSDFWKEWAAIAVGSSPLYGVLGASIAEDPQIRAIAGTTSAGQLAPNMLLGAVHYLLLGGANDPLRRFYRTLEGGDPPEEAYPEFRDFVLRFQTDIEPILKQRAVQTNEVARSSVLLAAYHFVAESSGRPLAIIELGTSAGLNLVFDRYHYSYNPGPSLGPPDSAVRLECLVRAGNPPDLSMPHVAWRRGVDLSPLDVTNADDGLWLQALIWPDQVNRFRRLRAAIAEFDTDPPQLVTGGIEALPGLMAEVPPHLTLCISHSFMISQLDESAAHRLDELVLASKRPTYRVAFEPDGDRKGWWLDVTTYQSGRDHSVRLAEAHFHGAWIRWLEEGVS